MASEFFQKAHNTIVNHLDKAMSGELSHTIAMASSFIKFGVSLYVLWFAYGILARKHQQPVPDLVWNLAKISFIAMFVTNYGGWTDSAINAIDGLKDTFQSGDPYKWADELWNKCQDLSKVLFEKDKSEFVPMEGTEASLYAYLGGILSLLSMAIVYFSAEISIKLLTVTAPLFIFCLMFGFLRQMFNSWLQMIFSSMLVFLFSGLAVRAGIAFYNGILTDAIAQQDSTNIVASGATALMAGIFLAWLVWQAKTYASQIASVGAEAAMQGSIAMGASAATFGAARMGMGVANGLRKQFTKTAGKGVGDAVGAATKPSRLGQAASALKNGVPEGGYQRAGKAAMTVGKAAVETAKKRYGG